MGNCNNCMVPNNDMNNQYITRDYCCQFTSQNFNGRLAEGRLTKQEVDSTLLRLEQHVGGFGKQWKFVGCYMIWAVCWVAAFIISMIVFGDPEDDDKKNQHGRLLQHDDKKDKEMTGGQLAALLIYIIGWFVAIPFLICYLVKFNRRIQAKMNEFFAQENQHYNMRGIMWTVFFGPKLQYIQIIFNNMMMGQGQIIQGVPVNMNQPVQEQAPRYYGAQLYQAPQIPYQA